MARLKISLGATVVLGVAVTHAVLLPALGWALMNVVEHSHAQIFEQYARNLTRALADALEHVDAPAEPQRAEALLDGAILNGEGVYAELVVDGVGRKSTLVSPHMSFPRRADFAFNSGGDRIYFISTPLDTPGHVTELRVGYDEAPTLAEIADARGRVIAALLIYAAVALSLAVVLAHQMARPVRELERAAARIGSGALQEPLATMSRIRELADLATAFEATRAELASAYGQLQAEIAALSSAEARREALEGVMRRRQRLESIGTLASGVAHEFNNALVPITLYTESALDYAQAAEVRSDLDRVLSAARRARDIVQQILAFSRDLGSERPQLVDLSGVIEEAAELFNRLAGAAVRVERHHEQSPSVMVDQALVMQLVMNLGTNAMQAMPNGGTLTFAVRPRTVAPAEAAGGPEALRAGRYVELSVADTGEGMTKDVRERIFEPFYTTRPVGAGTGLGLAVVHGIATEFGAQIEVDSTPGEGTTFRVLFPEAAGSALPAHDAAIADGAQA
jgi:signal transduction histidine kinase